MNIFQYTNSFVKGAILFLISFFSILFNTAQAQFTITENFKGQVGADIIIGGDAALTSGVGDPIGAGWLRLTPGGVANQRGYAYINRTFPSTLGVVIDFEYKLWRKVNNNEFTAGDGFSIFLFDGQYGPSNFKPGGYGGALNYAPLVGGSPWDIPGLTGGYIGLGFDSFGNYGNEVEGRFGSIEPDEANGSASSYRPNSIILRGPTTSNRTSEIINGIQPTNRYLSGKKLGSRSSNANTTRDQSEVHYFPLIQQRPTDKEFYRRVQIEINPIVIGQSYRITARWAKSPTGPFEPLFESVTNDIPPALLKLGFGAATGGARQYHEIRNLVVTTPGNLRVTKMANKDILRANNGAESDIAYTIEVNNDTDAALTNVVFKDRITDGAGNLVTPEMFTITSISHPGIKPSPDNPNELIGSLNIAAKSVERITVKGKLLKVPVGNILVNTATALPTDIRDDDLENNTSTVSTPVIAEGVDLIVSNKVTEACLSPAGNTFTVTIANMGSSGINYGGAFVPRSNDNNPRSYTTNRLELSEIVPPGATIMSSTVPDGWELVDTKTNTPKVGYTTYIYQTKFTHPTSGSTTPSSNTLASGSTLPAFTFKLKGNTSYTNEVQVRLVQENGTLTYNRQDRTWTIKKNNNETSTLEPEENRGNNSASASVLITPPVPTLTQNTFYYCQGEEAMPLQILPTNPNYKVVWYSSVGGVPLNNVPTPITTRVGTTSYFVSQTNSSCESAAVEIQIVVLPPPTAGTISGDREICIGTAASTISSTEDATAPNWPDKTTITYRWEKLAPTAGSSWTTIQGATAANYTPAAETTVGVWKYRRVAIPVFAGKESACRPEAISKEVSITVKNCLIISNPMLRSKAKK
ncbi:MULTISPECIES: hypothetical protein [Sphingobacterium]|uniref:hypothetical protein n=1 Tax=Sphingobacterium TaxID=28453 RepID=UPI0013D9D919|nr:MULTISPECIES: hypothetical protein [unclassified Sphingobacterium]